MTLRSPGASGVTVRAFNHKIGYVSHVQGILNPKGFKNGFTLVWVKLSEVYFSEMRSRLSIWNHHLVSYVTPTNRSNALLNVFKILNFEKRGNS